MSAEILPSPRLFGKKVGRRVSFVVGTAIGTGLAARSAILDKWGMLLALNAGWSTNG